MTPLTNDQRAVVASLYPLAMRWAAEHWKFRPWTRELARDAALDAAIYTAQRFDPTRGTTIEGMLSVTVGWRIKHALRREAQRPGVERRAARSEAQRVEAPAEPPDVSKHLSRATPASRRAMLKILRGERFGRLGKRDHQALRYYRNRTLAIPTS